MRIFLDANVIFSAANAGSVTDTLLDRAQLVATLVTCELAVEEARRNVQRKRPAWLNHFENRIGHIEMAPTLAFALPVELAGKDVPLLCSAIRAQCNYFATGDAQDFGHLYDQTVQGVRVVSLLGLANVVRLGTDSP